MTTSRDDVIRMAHEAGMDSTSGWRDNGETDTYYEAWPEQLERFAAMVAESAAAAEREACAAMASEYGTWGGSNFRHWFEQLAAAIRARGTKP